MQDFLQRIGVLCLLAAVTCAAQARAQEAPLPDRVGFNRDIRPILSDKCYRCHGPDAGAREAGLRLDVREEAVAVREGGAAIVPGDIAASALVARIAHADVGMRMPPVESERTLTARQIALLTRWIEQGAAYEPHWSYLPPVAGPLPEVADPAWTRNPIDRFVLARLEGEGLQPAPEADRVTLARRLSFDLLGLPPSREEVAAFAGDTSPDAYERLVERLLASPQFGERLAIYWLDLVRYADTVGYHGDQVRGASGYRDYVINAFNANMPFDQFTREQLGGDLLPEPTREQLLASGYNRLNMVTREGGAQDADYLARYAADRVRTTASVWLGSSLGCAECHDHKFDPFTAKDFYSFGAFFADIREQGVQVERGNLGSFPPFLLLGAAEEAAELANVDAELAALKQLPAGSPEATAAREKMQHLGRRQREIEEAVTNSVITEHAEHRTMRVLARGSWQDTSGEIVSPAVPAFLGRLETGERRATRLDLADWLTSRENPLTARVFVNRLWKLYFGTGLSKVLDDVGSQGEWPTHPALLDYLALEFVESGWDIKHMVRLMVTSAAYRQSSATRPELKTRDPYNRLLARQSRLRLDAELIRDNALKVSGLLSLKMGGRSVMPYQPEGYYRELNFPERTYQQDTGENLYRRGVYTHWQRTYLHPSLMAFDAPAREECTAERPVSNSPQQALALLNDPIFVEAARVFAERVLATAPASTAEGVAFACEEALSREPTAAESRILEELFDRNLAEFSADEAAASAFLEVGEKPAPENTDPVKLAAWSSVTRALLNLHESIHRY